jgi:hypothetical protein
MIIITCRVSNVDTVDNNASNGTRAYMRSAPSITSNVLLSSMPFNRNAPSANLLSAPFPVFVSMLLVVALDDIPIKRATCSSLHNNCCNDIVLSSAIVLVGVVDCGNESVVGNVNADGADDEMVSINRTKCLQSLLCAASATVKL